MLEAGIETRPTFIRHSIRPLGQQAYHFGKGIIRYYEATAAAAFVCLHFVPYRIPECSIHSKSFALCEQQPKIPSPECSTHMGERIYYYPQTDCFVVSQLFSVARHVGRLMLGSKPVQIYVRFSIRPLSQQAYHIGWIISIMQQQQKQQQHSFV